MVSEKKLAICHNKGFHIRFENGWTVSVQFGAGNYCDNYDSNDLKCENPAQSDNAEVWCFSENGNNYPKEPTNRSTPEEILEIMNKVSQFRKSTTTEVVK